MNIKSLNEKLICLEEELLDEKKKSKKKKPYDSVTYTTGDIQKNIDHFNKMLGGKAENNHTDGYLNGTFKGPEAASPDGASCVSGDSGEGNKGGGGMSESLALNEDSFYASKIGVEVELPNNVHILDKEQIKAFLPHLEPEEEFTIGYITPLYFYQELWSKFTLLKCTELVGYTGIDYIEARSDNANKEQRIAAAKQTAELGNDNGIHLDRQPDARQVGDFSADYELTNKTVKQHRDNSKNTPEVIAKNLSTILFYPKVGSQPKVIYYIDLHNGMGYLKVSREQIEPTILKRVAEIANELDSGKNKDGSPRKRRWNDAQLAAKIRKQLETDAATITAVPLSAEDKFETRSRFFDGSSNVSKPQVRALYTNQIYLLETKDAKVGKSLIESLTEAKRYVRRYYMKPQNIFCSNKDEVLKALIDHEDEDCIIYTLINLGDIKDVSKLNSNDIIYYYEDGILYDKNHVRIFDYELSIKHEEERPRINPEQVSDAKLAAIYQDRMASTTSLDEENNVNSQSRPFLVYCHTNKINGKKYIGITTQRDKNRWRSGDGYKNQPVFYMAIQKYGWANFEHEILAQNLSENEAKTLEQKYIAYYHTYINDPQNAGYNASIGGEANLKYSTDEQRKEAARLSHAKSKALHGDTWAENAKQKYKDNLEFFHTKNKLNYEKHKQSYLAHEKIYMADLKSKLDIIWQLNLDFPDRLSEQDKQRIINFRHCRNAEYINYLLNLFSEDEIAIAADRMTGVSDLDEAFKLDFDNINAYGDKLTESQSQEIENSYKQLSKMYNVDLEELVYGEDGFMKSCYPNGFEDFAGDVIYSEKYWNEFEKWLKDVKGIELNELDLDFNDVNVFGELLKEGKESNKCCICGEAIDGYGNNPEPYKHDGRCCDACNLKFVIPARLEQINISEEE